MTILCKPHLWNFYLCDKSTKKRFSVISLTNLIRFCKYKQRVWCLQQTQKMLWHGQNKTEKFINHTSNIVLSDSKSSRLIDNINHNIDIIRIRISFTGGSQLVFGTSGSLYQSSKGPSHYCHRNMQNPASMMVCGWNNAHEWVICIYSMQRYHRHRGIWGFRESYSAIKAMSLSEKSVDILAGQC